MFGFTDVLEDSGSNTAAVSVDNGALRIDSMGTSKKIIVKRDNNTTAVGKAAPRSGITIPEFGTTQKFSPSKYYVYEE